jgi:hypothetical protein
MTIPALKAALEAMSAPTFDTQQCAFLYTHKNGFQELISHGEACARALDCIAQLEIDGLKFAVLRKSLGDETIDSILRGAA